VLIDQDTGGIDESETGWGATDQSRRPMPWGWFALVGVILVSAVIWSLSNINRSKTQLDHIRATTQTLIAEEDDAEKDALRTVERVESTMRHFFRAESMEEMLPLVRQPERVAPLMKDHYARNRFTAMGEFQINGLQPVTLGRKANFWMASVKTKDGLQKNLLIEETDAGEVLIDWETHVCYQPMPWDEYATKRPVGTSLDFRVHANPDQFFSHEFTNSTQWRCYRLTALDSEETLFGYAPAGSETAEILENHFRVNGSNPSALILRLRLPEGLESRRGVVIEKVLSSRWLYIEPPSDGS
jgi:hypothetical protein